MPPVCIVSVFPGGTAEDAGRECIPAAVSAVRRSRSDISLPANSRRGRCNAAVRLRSGRP